jgi:hypothetical protein
MFLASDSSLTSFFRYSGILKSLEFQTSISRKKNYLAPRLHFIHVRKKSNLPMEDTRRPHEKKLGKLLVVEELSISSTKGIQASATKEMRIANSEM